MPDLTNNNNNLVALISLLDEPDEKAYDLILGQILLHGANAIVPLEKCLENTFNSIVQERIQSILRKLKEQKLFDDFSNWLNVDSSDLLKGFILVSKTQFPSLDENDVLTRIEKLKRDIWLELHEDLTALENIKVLNHILFGVHQFSGNTSETTDPEANCINSLLENKTGSPLSLGMLFIILAQKLGLPVFGVNLPQHFILAYLNNTGIENPGEDDVLFYLNPYNKGVVFTRREIELFIGQMKIKPENSFFQPCTNSDIAFRLINNLIFSYNQSGETDRIEILETLLTAFK